MAGETAATGIILTKPSHGNSKKENGREKASDKKGRHEEDGYTRGLVTHRNVAARITRAVLHAVRDRLPADDAVQFGQGLPMALKGVYFDQNDLSRSPVVIRHADDFLRFVCAKEGRVGFRDFPDPGFIEAGIHAVFTVLENHMDHGQVEQVRHQISAGIAEMTY